MTCQLKARADGPLGGGAAQGRGGGGLHLDGAAIHGPPDHLAVSLLARVPPAGDADDDGAPEAGRASKHELRAGSGVEGWSVGPHLATAPAKAVSSRTTATSRLGEVST